MIVSEIHKIREGQMLLFFGDGGREMAYYGLAYLRNKLRSKRTRIETRYQFYEMKNLVKDFGISTPPELEHWMSCLGWCGKAVDTLADRLQFREFKDDNLAMNEIYQMNNPDVLFDSATLSALICSCSFIYISQGEGDMPRLQVIDGSNATGIMDPITGMLKEGYAVLERDKNGNPSLEAYYIPGETYYIYSDGRPPKSWRNKAPYPLLVPIIFRPDAKRPFGHSRISRSCMEQVSSAIRTIKRSEIAAEFFSFPQKYATGVSEDAIISDKWKAAMSVMMMFTADDEGNKPTIGQFSQQSMSPHLEQLKMFASLFAGETGLTLDDLGFTSGNPASAEAIKSAHENLRLTARKAQRTFGTGFLNAGYLAACLRDDFEYRRDFVYRTTPSWEPVFEPDAAMLSGIGDALIKIEQSHPGYITDDKLRELVGF